MTIKGSFIIPYGIKPLIFLKKQVAAATATATASRFSRVRLCATPETAAHQAPLSMGFSRQEYWSGLPFPTPVF